MITTGLVVTWERDEVETFTSPYFRTFEVGCGARITIEGDAVLVDEFAADIRATLTRLEIDGRLPR